MVYFYLFSKYNSPTPFSLDFTHAGNRRWVAITTSIAVWNLIKAVFSR